MGNSLVLDVKLQVPLEKQSISLHLVQRYASHHTDGQPFLFIGGGGGN